MSISHCIINANTAQNSTDPSAKHVPGANLISPFTENKSLVIKLQADKFARYSIERQDAMWGKHVGTTIVKVMKIFSKARTRHSGVDIHFFNGVLSNTTVNV